MVTRWFSTRTGYICDMAVNEEDVGNQSGVPQTAQAVGDRGQSLVPLIVNKVASMEGFIPSEFNVELWESV